MTTDGTRVGLFVTCLVDLFRPPVGFASVRLLEAAGCIVEVPFAQTCCGQPAYNSGAAADARDLARNVIEAFEGYDYVVAPSGSCAAMISVHYPALLGDDAEYGARALELGQKTFELCAFLSDVLGIETVEAAFEGSVTLHDACSGLRELGIHDQPRKLLESVRGLTLVEHVNAAACCGFGGTFSVKYGELSDAMAGRKISGVEVTDADLLVSGDLGCLMNLAGKLTRQGSAVDVRHIAEILAGDLDAPPVGKTRQD